MIRVYVESDDIGEGKSSLISAIHHYLTDRGADVEILSFPESMTSNLRSEIINKNSKDLDWIYKKISITELMDGWNPSLTKDERSEYESLKKKASILEASCELPE